jgi:hypothetical protein
MSISVVNLQDNRAVFRIFIALLRFSFDSPSYKHNAMGDVCRTQYIYENVLGVHKYAQRFSRADSRKEITFGDLDVGGRIIYMMDTQVTGYDGLEGVHMPQDGNWRGRVYVR